MSRNRLLWGLPLCVVLVAAVILMTQRGESAPSPGQPDNEKVAQLKPAVGLPISQVILFNSGVGHFTRSQAKSKAMPASISRFPSRTSTTSSSR